jgi:2-methylisocitrate lyase-like PEP mutase family enzyme
MNKNSKAILRDRVNQRNALLVPGAFNALSARMIADLGFEALYLSGAGLTNTSFVLRGDGYLGE